jgi:Zn-dependent protease
MQTLQGIRFVPVTRVDGILLGLDAAWLGVRGWGLMLLLAVAALAGPLTHDATTPAWARLGAGLSIVAAIVLTSLGHELGHVVASRLAGLSVRAVVLAPQGGMTIRAASDDAMVNFFTALAGPLSNAILGTLCFWLAVAVGAEGLLRDFLIELAALQLLTALANLLPCGPMDGRRMLAALLSGSGRRHGTVGAYVGNDAESAVRTGVVGRGRGGWSDIQIDGRRSARHLLAAVARPGVRRLGNVDVVATDHHRQRQPRLGRTASFHPTPLLSDLGVGPY